MMAFEPLVPVRAADCSSSATALFKPNIRPRSAAFTRPAIRRRDRAYSIFYVGINLGAFLAPLVCGTLGEELGWHYGFAAAGVGMTDRACDLSAALRSCRRTNCTRPKLRTRASPIDRDDWRAIVALLLLFVPNTLFWATYEQQGNTIALWADTNTDRRSICFWRGEIPVTWFQAFNPFMIFAFTPFIVALWASGEGAREPSTVSKMAIGCFGVALSYLIMVVAALMSAGGKASWLWLFAVLRRDHRRRALSVARRAVAGVQSRAGTLLSMMMGVWLATSFVGKFLAGCLGTYWSSMEKPRFFLMIAGVAAAAGVSIILLNRPLRKSLQH